MSITPYVNQIKAAAYGVDVRDSIVNALNECYKDATGNNNSIAALVQQYAERDDTVGAAVAALTGLYGDIGSLVMSQRLTDFSSITVPNNTPTLVDTITLTKGKWLIFGGVAAPTGSSGYCAFILSHLDTGVTIANASRLDGVIPVTANYGGRTGFRFYKTVTTESQDWYAWEIQTSGDETNALPWMFAVKIKGEALEEGNPLYNQLVKNAQAIQTLQTNQGTTSSALSTLQKRHLSDMLEIEEDLAGNVSVLSSRLEDLENADRVITGDVDGMQEIVDQLNSRRMTVDENGYLEIQNSPEYIRPEEQAAIEEVLVDWLNDHPEATTTVQDGAINEDKLSTSVKNNLASLQEQITTNNDARINEIAVERSRIDALSSLPEGTSALDAEVMDIRRGADNATYGTAGTAVRTQITNLSDNIGSVSSNVSALETQVSAIPVIHYFTKIYTLSGAGWAKITLPNGSDMTYPTYKVLNCYTATTSNGANIVLNTTIYNANGTRTWWIKAINGNNLTTVASMDISTEVAYIQI